ncbi:MAG: sigma-70 family RNA polymerase sigma factor [Treponema sp.]|nr:sigma-70 family RNA polymerase sigma factor [Treponema sp.]
MKTLTNSDFAGVYEKYAPMVLRRCRSILKDEEKALDAMQDVFVRLMESRTPIKQLCASLFYVTATRVCLNKIRSDRLRQGFDLDAVAEVMADDFAEKEFQKVEAGVILERIFSGRDVKDSLIASLHFVDGLTLEETAGQVSMSVSGVRKRISELKKFSVKFMNRPEAL